jgi:hypothetical protein
LRVLVPATLTAGLLMPAIGASQDTAPITAAYSVIDLDRCRVLKRHKDGDSWRCTGLKGWPVYVAEGDMRTFVSFGTGAERRRAANETYPSFNTIFHKQARRATVEWRVHKVSGAPKPFATILRYRVSGGESDRPKEMLIVFKLTSTESCQVAYVDANGDSANETARHVADKQSRDLVCGAGVLRFSAKGERLPP